MNKTKIIAFILAVACLAALPAAAQLSGTETFNNFIGPSVYNGSPNFFPPEVHSGPLTFSGGMLLTNTSFDPHGTVFATAGAYLDDHCNVSIICNACSPQLVVSSQQTMLGLTFDLMQANDSIQYGRPLDYVISDLDDPTGQSSVTWTVGGVGILFHPNPVNLTVPFDTKNIGIRIKEAVNTAPQCGAAPNYWNFAIDNVTWYFAQPRRLVTAPGTNPDGASGIQTQLIEDGKNAHVDVTYPTGLPFFMRVEAKQNDNSWKTVDAEYKVDEIEDTVFPADILVQLFQTHHLWFYGDFTSASYKAFQTVHGGNVKLELNLNRGDAIPSFNVDLHIVKPDALGETFSGAFDDLFSALGDQAGIPPQYLKAQALAEGKGRFVGNQWHYLPLTVDYPDLHILNDNDIDHLPYRNYALQEKNQHEGHLLCPPGAVTAGEPPHDCGFGSPIDDIAPRYGNGLFYTDQNGNRLPLAQGSDLLKVVTIRQIVNAMPLLDAPDPAPQFGATKLVAGPLSGHHRPSVPPPDPLNVSAQTPWASRYGLLQVIAYQAYRSGHWFGVQPPIGGDKRQNPSLLFDFESNVDVEKTLQGPGSLAVGVSTDAEYFRNANGSNLFFATPYDYVNGPLLSMFGTYKGDFKKYPDEIINVFAPDCLPTTHKSIFPATTGSGGSCAPVIDYQTTTVPAIAGAPVTLYVAADPSNGVTRYQWYRGSSGDISSPIANADYRYLTVSPNGSAQYWVVLSNRCGTTASRTMSINIVTSCPSVSISTNPTGATITQGDSTTLHVSAVGATSYQWYIGNGPLVAGMNGDRSDPILDSNTPDFTVQPTTTTSYWVEARNGCGAALSSTAVVTVNGPACVPPSVASQPASQTINAGGTAILSAAFNGTAPITVQWTTSGGAAAGSGNSITVSPSVTATYIAHATNACGSVDSDPATITVNQVPTCQAAAISAQPQDTTVTAGGSVSLSLIATGTAPISVQWSTSDGTNVGSGTSITVAPQQTTSYYATVSNACGSVRSRTATVSVVAACDPLVITQQPTAEQTIIVGQSAGYLSVTVTGTSPHYQWYVHDRISGNDSPIAGATISNYTTSQPGDYFCRITNDCSSVDTIIATILAGVACGPAGVFDQTHDQTITAGDSVTLSVNPSGSSPFEYQWYQLFPDGSKTPIGTTRDVAVTPTVDVTQYYCIVTNQCGTGGSQIITITLCHPPAITQQPMGPVFSGPGTSATISVGATGTNLHYAWFANSAPVGFDSPSITVFAPTAPTFYDVVISGDCGSVTSQVVAACVMPSITTQPVSQNVSAGNAATLSLVASGTTPLTVNWYTSGGTLVGSGTSISVTPSATTSYYATVSNSCGTVNSNTVTVTVVASCIAPSITQQPQSVTITQGNSTTLSVTATGDAPLQYQWYSGSGVPVSFGTGPTVTVAPTQTQSFYVMVTNGCGSVKSSTVTVTVNCIAPQITQQPPPSVTITSGQIVTISINATGSLLQTQWFEQFPTDAFPHAVVNGVNTFTLSIGGTDTPSGTQYTCKVFNGCGSVTSTATTLNVQ